MDVQLIIEQRRAVTGGPRGKAGIDSQLVGSHVRAAELRNAIMKLNILLRTLFGSETLVGRFRQTTGGRRKKKKKKTALNQSP